MKILGPSWLSVLLVVVLSGGCSGSIEVNETGPKSAAPQSSPTIATNNDDPSDQPLPADQQVTTQKTDYAPNESIRVRYDNLPGNKQDWVTVVKASDPEDTYGEWFYTEGRKSGSHQFKGLPAGQYEARVYHNWPEGQYVIQDRHQFNVSSQGQGVSSGSGDLGPQKSTYAENESITVKYANLPGNQQDWINVVKASDPEDTYGEWFYTEGKTSGSHTFKGLPAGRYEMRVYHNWPEGDFVVQERYPFTVGN